MGVTRQRARRVGLRAALALCGVALTLLAGCSADTVGELKRLGLPVAATEQAPAIGNLWIGTWIAAGSIGIAVWGLIGWAALRYKSDHNEMPRQNRYNLPMEIFYTVAPFVVIGVLFYYTILAQDVVQKNPDPDVTVESVVGTRVYHLQFNYVGTHEQLWNNAEFRRGIDALLNRESIVESIMAGQGTVAYNPFPGDWPFSPTPLDHPHGTEVALQHFKAAGLDVTDGMVTLDGQPLTMKIVGAARLHGSAERRRYRRRARCLHQLLPRRHQLVRNGQDVLWRHPDFPRRLSLRHLRRHLPQGPLRRLRRRQPANRLRHEEPVERERPAFWEGGHHGGFGFTAYGTHLHSIW